MKTAVEKAISEYQANYDAYSEEWLSTSALATLMKCGIRFQKQYLERIKAARSIRLLSGSGAHKARELNLAQKVDTHEDLSVNNVTDAARDAVNSAFEEGPIRPEKEFKGLSKVRTRGKAVDLATGYSREDYGVFQTTIQPEAVEETLCVKYPGLSRLVVGKLDIRMPGGVIRDLKTGKRLKGQAFCDESQAFSTYGILHWNHFGVIPDKYIIDNVVSCKDGYKSQVYETTRTADDLQRQLARFAQAMKVIESGAFLPADPESWWCSEDWCGFWHECPYGGGK